MKVGKSTFYYISSLNTNFYLLRCLNEFRIFLKDQNFESLPNNQKYTYEYYNMTDNISRTLERDRLIRRVARGAGITILGMFVSRLFGYAIRMVMARSLTTQGFGQIGIVQSLITIITVIGLLGLPTALTRQIAFYRARNDNKNVIQTIHSGLWISLPAAILLVLIIWSTKGWLSTNVFHDITLVSVLALFALVIPFLALEQLMGAILLGFQRVRTYTIIHDIFRFSVTLLLIVIFLKLYQPIPTHAALAYLISYIIAGVIYLFSCRNHLNGVFRIPNLFNATTKKLLTFSWPLVLSSLLWILLPRTDIIMLGFFKNTLTVGLYNAAVPLGELIPIFARAFIPIFIPLFTELISQDRWVEIRDLYKIITRWTIAATMPLFFVVMLSPEHFLNMLFGSRYLEAAQSLQILTLGYFLPLLLGPTSSYLTTMGKTKTVMINTIIIYILNVSLNLLLIPRFGLIGAAAATATSFVIYRFITLVEVYYYSRTHPFNLQYLRLLIAGSITGIIYYFLLNHYSPNPGQAWTLLGILLIICLVYSANLIVFRTLNKDDLMILKNIKKRLIG